jgi:hypothetical protein
VTDPFAEFDTPRRETPPRPGDGDEVPADTDSAADAADASEAEAAIEPAHERRRRWPGYWSFGVAAGMLLVTITAIAFASLGEAVWALTLTASALALAGIAVVLGLVSIFGRYARPWGIIGAAVGLLVNPLVLLYGLSAMGLY